MLKNLKVTDDSKMAQREVVSYLDSIGFSCKTEVKVPLKEKGKSGRIDIIVKKEKLTMAIELDRLNPRKKSIRKLKENEFDVKIILCRGGNKSYKIDNIYILPLKIK